MCVHACHTASDAGAALPDTAGARVVYCSDDRDQKALDLWFSCSIMFSLIGVSFSILLAVHFQLCTKYSLFVRKPWL